MDAGFHVGVRRSRSLLPEVGKEEDDHAGQASPLRRRIAAGTQRCRNQASSERPSSSQSRTGDCETTNQDRVTK